MDPGVMLTVGGDSHGEGHGVGPMTPRWRRLLVIEVWIVFAISLGASGVSSLLDLIKDLTVALDPTRDIERFGDS